MTTGAARIAVIWDIGGYCDQLDDALFELVLDTRARTLQDGLPWCRWQGSWRLPSR